MSNEHTDSGDDSLVSRFPTRRVLSVGLLLLLVLIVLPFVIYAVPQVVGAEHSYIVLSGSMEPTISPGDVVIVEQTPAEEIAEGDIITFVQDGADRTTTHRVVEVVQEGDSLAFRTRGDNNDAADQELVQPQQIQGEIPSIGGALFIIPYLGHVIRFTSTSTGFALLVIVPVGLLMTTEVYSLVKKARSDDGSDDDTRDDIDGDGDFTSHPPLVENGDTTVTEYDSGPVTHVDSAAVSGSFGQRTNSTTQKQIIVETAATSDTEADESGGITFTTAELELGLVVLLAFFAYSAWTAINSFTTVSFAVTGASGAAFLLLSALYVAGRLSSDSVDDSEQTPIADSESRARIDSERVEEQILIARLHADALTAALVASQAGVDDGATLERPTLLRFERESPLTRQSQGGGDDD